jgi:hypothetical protein
MPSFRRPKKKGGGAFGAAATAPFMLPKLNGARNRKFFDYTPSSRSLRTRSSIGGWVENRAAIPPP